MTTNPFATALGTATTNNSEPKITITKHHLKKKNKVTKQSIFMSIRDDIAYIPSVAKSPDGYNFLVFPILSSPVELEPLTKISEETLSKLDAHISMEDAEKIRNSKKPKDIPILQATGSSSYRDLEKNSIVYSIQRYENDWLLFLPEDSEKDVELTFPQTTPIKELVQIIVDDYWQKRRNKK